MRRAGSKRMVRSRAVWAGVRMAGQSPLATISPEVLPLSGRSGREVSMVRSTVECHGLAGHASECHGR